MQAHTHTPAAIPAPPVHTHMQSPLHTLTHTAHPYTYLKISTNINSPQLSQSLFTNICKYPHSTSHLSQSLQSKFNPYNPYNNNCHNPFTINYNQNSILTILTITTVTIPYQKKKKNCHNTTFEDSRPLCAGHGVADAL